MIKAIRTKYLLAVHPKSGVYRPIHDAINGSTVAIIDLEIGKRGWIAYECKPDNWHRVHFSTVEDINIDRNGDLVVTTKNTVYVFSELEDG